MAYTVQHAELGKTLGMFSVARQWLRAAAWLFTPGLGDRSMSWSIAQPRRVFLMFTAFLTSTGIVALAEMGDKTQLLALILAARFRKPTPIILGILIATIFNHALASALGAWISTHLDPTYLRWGLAATFIAMAIWILIPDKIEEEQSFFDRFGVFGATLIAFFIAEMGDKTQIATVMLTAKFNTFYAVVAGTTLGMLIANVPAVFLGDKITKVVPVEWVHRIAAFIFLVLGGLAIWNPGA